MSQIADTANYWRAEQIGLRCRIGDRAAMDRYSAQCAAVANRYEGGHVLGDIDVCRGEFVYRAVIPRGAVEVVQSSVARRKRRWL